MKFSELQLEERVHKGIEAAGFETCMPVQEEVLKYSLSGQDVLVQSQTGSGKTAAFIITILQQYVEKAYGVRSLIIVPTRELAVQIKDDAELLASGIENFSAVSFFGGMGYKQQEADLRAGVDIIIGTPGRLLDFESSGKIDFKQFDIVVIDEADRLFDMGFFPDIRKMLQKMRPKEERQTMLFSATLPVRIQNLAWSFQNNPKSIEIEPEQITVNEITQSLYHVANNEKISLLLGLVRKFEPKNALIFTNTRQKAVEVSRRLEKNGYQAEFIMGDLPQRKRLQIIQRMKKGELRFLAATDVAARGLHVDDLGMVINFDIPEDYENYVHRIGRTARAGKSGKAIAFACEQFVYGLEPIEKYIDMKIPVEPVTEDLLAEDASAHISSRQLTRDALPSGRPAGSGGSSRSSSRSGRPPQRPPQQGRKPGSSGSGRGARSNSSNRSSDSNKSRRSGGSSSSPAPSRNQKTQNAESSKQKPANTKPANTEISNQKPSSTKSSGRSKPSEQRPSGAESGSSGSSGSKTKPKSNNQRGSRGSSPEKKQAEGRSGSKDYDALKAMSLDERVEHYKKQFNQDSTQTDAQSSGRKSQDAQTSGKQNSNRKNSNRQNSGKQAPNRRPSGGKASEKQSAEKSRKKTAAAGQKAQRNGEKDQQNGEERKSGLLDRIFKRKRQKK